MRVGDVKDPVAVELRRQMFEPEFELFNGDFLRAAG